MIALNYIINDKGEKTALVIDLVKLKECASTEEELQDLVEDIHDAIAVETGDKLPGRLYNDVRNEILNA